MTSGKKIDAPLTEVGSPDVLRDLRSLGTRHPKRFLIIKLTQQIKNYQDGNCNPAEMPALMARTLQELRS